MPNCMCCNRILESKDNENPAIISPVYGGLIFRSTGNYGSTVFDPIEDGDILQVVICDDCMKKKAKWVTRIYNIKHETIADVKPFDVDRG